MNCLGLLSVLLLGGFVSGESLIVVTESGKVRGKEIYDEETSAHYFAFKCIPYAAAPVGNLRFQAPEPVKKWRNVLSAESCEMCPQIDFFTHVYQGNEDCLKLNIFTPINPEHCDQNEPLPVMVFITGGEWRVDTAERYHPELFMKTEKVILVTFNYRLGALGFLSTGDEIVPGNNGLKDQVMALKWIQENIRAFGGNPRKVTIFGSSAGGASVRYHMLSPMSKDLFVGGISHSSNELNTWTWQSTGDAVRLFRSYSKKLNCSMWDTEDVIDCLSKVSAKDLVETEAYQFEDARVQDALTLFKPVTEVPTENSFLCKNPVDVLADGEGNDVPLMIGLTENEGAYRYVELLVQNKIDQIFDNLHWLLPKSSASWRLGLGQREEILERVRQFYFPDKIKDNEEKRIQGLIDYISDSWFLQGHNDMLELHTANLNAPIYQYVLTFNRNLSFSQWAGYPQNFGASHYDEELYLFPSDIYFPGNVKSAEILEMTKTMLHLWTHFAISQTPLPAYKSLKWEPVSVPGYDYLDIIGPKELVMKQNFHYKRAEFWRNLAAEYVLDKYSCE